MKIKKAANTNYSLTPKGKRDNPYKPVFFLHIKIIIMANDKNQIRIGHPLITVPNMVGYAVRETPKTVIIWIAKRDFKAKCSKTLTHKFTKEEREWYGMRVGFGKKFWKKTGKEIGGKCFLIDPYIN